MANFQYTEIPKNALGSIHEDRDHFDWSQAMKPPLDADGEV